MSRRRRSISFLSAANPVACRCRPDRAPGGKAQREPDRRYIKVVFQAYVNVQLPVEAECEPFVRTR
jgi:hypothetical protein